MKWIALLPKAEWHFADETQTNSEFGAFLLTPEQAREVIGQLQNGLDNIDSVEDKQ